MRRCNSSELPVADSLLKAKLRYEATLKWGDDKSVFK
jgi:hypothetical protein